MLWAITLFGDQVAILKDFWKLWFGPWSEVELKEGIHQFEFQVQHVYIYVDRFACMYA